VTFLKILAPIISLKSVKLDIANAVYCLTQRSTKYFSWRGASRGSSAVAELLVWEDGSLSSRCSLPYPVVSQAHCSPDWSEWVSAWTEFTTQSTQQSSRKWIVRKYTYIIVRQKHGTGLICRIHQYYRDRQGCQTPSGQNTIKYNIILLKKLSGRSSTRIMLHVVVTSDQ